MNIPGGFMKQFIVGIFTMLFTFPLCAQMETKDSITFTPIEHASFIIRTTNAVLYVDPVGDVKAYARYPAPTVILLTDIHGDHLAPDLVTTLKTEKTMVIGPKAVTDKLQGATTLKNGERIQVGTIEIEAIPMYNLTKERLKFHEKGRGNGYVLRADGKRIYISGDTEDIPEMRGLNNIDYAFVCMNLPYTMSVEQAASAVLAFKPKVVFPYHYKGTGGFSDVNKFKELVGVNPSIEVRLLRWYGDSK